MGKTKTEGMTSTNKLWEAVRKSWQEAIKLDNQLVGNFKNSSSRLGIVAHAINQSTQEVNVSRSLLA